MSADPVPASLATPLPTVLVVGPDSPEIAGISAELSTRGFRVTAVPTFGEAKTIIADAPPAILISALRLGEYNGLHLALRLKTSREAVAALVLADWHDAGLERESQAIGATFVVNPVTGTDLVAAVWRTLYWRSDAPPVRPPFERRVTERRSLPLPVATDRRAGERRVLRGASVLPPSTSHPHGTARTVSDVAAAGPLIDSGSG